MLLFTKNPAQNELICLRHHCFQETGGTVDKSNSWQRTRNRDFSHHYEFNRSRKCFWTFDLSYLQIIQTRISQ